jgi:xanthine/CO dehydrogenase XdhC/CoxF family maturation factor
MLCVNRIQKTLILVAAVALPAAAQSTFAPTRETQCFASGTTTYQIARNAPSPDFRVKIADASANPGSRPDLRMRLVDSAEKADFVLVDDFSAGDPAPCRSSTPIRTVALDADTAKPDVTITLSADAALSDYKIYVHSARFSQQDAAALLAAMWKTEQRREATGSIR